MFYYLLNEIGVPLGEASDFQDGWVKLKKCPDIEKYKYNGKKWILIDTSVK